MGQLSMKEKLRGQHLRAEYKERRVAAMSQVKGPSNPSLALPITRFGCIKQESTKMTSRWDNSPVCFPDYDYLPQGTELAGIFGTLTSVESISLSGPHPNSPLQPMCHPEAKISTV